MRNLILVGVLRKIFKIQVCFVPRKSIFDLFGQKWPARMVTVKQLKSCDIIENFGIQILEANEKCDPLICLDSSVYDARFADALIITQIMFNFE